MKAGLAAVAVAWLGGACVSNDDVSAALASYCEAADGKAACDSDTECCPGFVCAAGACRPTSAGLCLTDGGSRSLGTGAACACSDDCGSGLCTHALCQ